MTGISNERGAGRAVPAPPVTVEFVAGERRASAFSFEALALPIYALIENARAELDEGQQATYETLYEHADRMLGALIALAPPRPPEALTAPHNSGRPGGNRASPTRPAKPSSERGR